MQAKQLVDSAGVPVFADGLKLQKISADSVKIVKISSFSEFIAKDIKASGLISAVLQDANIFLKAADNVD